MGLIIWIGSAYSAHSSTIFSCMMKPIQRGDDLTKRQITEAERSKGRPALDFCNQLFQILYFSSSRLFENNSTPRQFLNSPFHSQTDIVKIQLLPLHSLPPILLPSLKADIGKVGGLLPALHLQPPEAAPQESSCRTKLLSPQRSRLWRF